MIGANIIVIARLSVESFFRSMEVDAFSAFSSCDQDGDGFITQVAEVALDLASRKHFDLGTPCIVQYPNISVSCCLLSS